MLTCVLHFTSLSTVSDDTNTSGTLSRSCGPQGTVFHVVPLDHVRESCCVSQLSLLLKGELLGSICWMWCMVALTNISAAMHLCKRRPQHAPPPPPSPYVQLCTQSQKHQKGIKQTDSCMHTDIKHSATDLTCSDRRITLSHLHVRLNTSVFPLAHFHPAPSTVEATAP